MSFPDIESQTNGAYSHGIGTRKADLKTKTNAGGYTRSESARQGRRSRKVVSIVALIIGLFLAVAAIVLCSGGATHDDETPHADGINSHREHIIAIGAERGHQDGDHHERRLGTGRFGGGIPMCADAPEGTKHCFPEGGVTLSKEITDSSSSVPEGKTFNKPMMATFGGAEQCCDASTYLAPATTVRWSEWAAADEAIDANEPVVIPCGTHVILNQSPRAPLKGLRIEGSLTVNDDNDAVIAVETGYVYNCGVLKANLETTSLTFTLVGHESIPGKAAFSTKAFVTQGGDIDLRGSMCNQTTWTLLAATADAGATELHLDGPVGAGWGPGTEIMVASTDFQGTQTEVATVTAVRDGGKTLTLKAGLVYPHAGVAPITAEIAALTRNIKITSEKSCAAIPNAEADNKPMCGHFVVDHTPRGVVCGVEVTNMGKHTTTGKYPMHMHMCGNAPDIQIRSNAVHSNHHRALVIHGTSNATWAENVVFRSVGHLLLTEDGGEEGNKIVRNVLALPKKPSPSWPKQCAGVVPSPYGGCEIKRCSHGTGIYEAVCGNRHDGETAAMWISNPANLIAHNRIIAGHNVGVRFETRGITGRVALLPDAVQKKMFRVGANRKSQGREQGLGGFVGNVIHSSRHGIFNYPSWNPSDGIVIDSYVAWKNGNAVFAKTKYAYKNPNLVQDEGSVSGPNEKTRMYSLRNATLLMNKISVYTIHDDSKLHVSGSVLAPQIPARLYPDAARDPIATAGACASERAKTMCTSESFCTAGGDGKFDSGSDGNAGEDNDGDEQSTSGSIGQTATVRPDITNAAACRKLPNGKWHRGVDNTFEDFLWRAAVDGADGTVEKPFGDWYYANPTGKKKYKRWEGMSSLELSRRPSCREAVFGSTMKDGIVDAAYDYPANPTKCVGAMGASPSTAQRVSSPGAASNTHQFNVYMAFREGKHTVAGLPWSISVDEATLAGARQNGYATWEEVGNGAGKRKKTGLDEETGKKFTLPGKLDAPLSCPSTGGQGCYLQAAGMQAHFGSHNKGYVHYGGRKRHRHPIVFPRAAEVAELQRAGRIDACPAETHEWHLLFRQTAPFKFDNTDDWAQAKRHNAALPESDNYSVLDTLDAYRGRGDGDGGSAFTLKLEYPNDPIAFAYCHNGDECDKAKRQENLRVWRQTNNPVEVATCINDGGRKNGDAKNVGTEVVGKCGVDDFENLFPTEWVPLAGKWGGLEYNGGGQAFISGSSYRRFGDSSVGTGDANWSIGSQQRWGAKAGDDKPVEVSELYACKKKTGDAEVAPPVDPAPPADDDHSDNGPAASGSWELVFRQTAPFTFSRADGWANALSLNAHDNTWPNFSVLDTLESFRGDQDDAFRFKLRYPTVGQENVWEQTTNPAVVATCTNNKNKPKTGNCGVEGFVPIALGVGSSLDATVWSGLEYNGDKALIDGADLNDGLYQLGARKTLRNADGAKVFPTFERAGDETQVELYVWKAAAAAAAAS